MKGTQRRLSKIRMPTYMDDKLYNYQRDANLSDQHRIILKDAYLHPYEKYIKTEKALQQVRNLMQQNIQKMINYNLSSISDSDFGMETLNPAIIGGMQRNASA